MLKNRAKNLIRRPMRKMVPGARMWQDDYVITYPSIPSKQRTQDICSNRRVLKIERNWRWRGIGDEGLENGTGKNGAPLSCSG